MSAMISSCAAFRYRIRSWKDVVLILVLAAAIGGLQFVFRRVFGMDARKARNLAGLIVCVAAFLIALLVACSS